MKWIDHEQLSIPYYTFENLEKTHLVTNAFTTRLYRKNGQPDNFFQPLLRKISDPAEVSGCIRLLTAQFGTDPDHLVSSAQKHTSNIHLVTSADLGPESSRPVLEYIDGLITNIPGVMLQTFGADCPSVYLLDPVRKAIGLCHSGRKGTQNHIASVMLRSMVQEYGTDPADVLAAVSPGICQDCYEVGIDVAEDFAQDYFSYPEADPDKKSALLTFMKGKYHIDLFQAIAYSLQSSGVKAANIEISHLCTKCRADIFYSFRAEGSISSENSALLMLRNN